HSFGVHHPASNRKTLNRPALRTWLKRNCRITRRGGVGGDHYQRISMLFGELVPKNLALSAPMGTAVVVTPVQRGFTAVLRPLILALNSAANAILHRFGVELSEELSGARSAQELSSLVRRSAQAGTLDKGTASLLTRAIALGDLSAVDVMTDRTRMRVVERDQTATDVINL